MLRDGRSVATGALADATNEALIAHMVGRPVDAAVPGARTGAARTTCALDVRDLVGAAGGARRRRFALRRGEILGIAGLVARAARRLVRALIGLDAGRVRATCASHGATCSRARRRRRRGSAPALGYLSEDRKGEGLALPMSLADNITLHRYRAVRAARVAAPAARSATQARALDRRRSASRRARPWQPVRTLSGGNQQKVALARLLHQDADVLLLDEPTRGIDIGSKAQIYEAIVARAPRGARPC